jgi:hypothetical protein
VIGTAVLRDYPLRLWIRQQEHTDAILREFMLLLGQREFGEGASSAPAQLVELAESITTQFGPLMTAINTTRQEALARGEDRIDSEVPLIEGMPALLQQIADVLSAVDEYCRSGDLLTLARPPEVVALTEWSLQEMIAQYNGAEPTPWQGPFN